MDTGAQRASVYVLTTRKSTYAGAVVAALAANPKAKILDAVELPTGGKSGVIAVGVNYAFWNEILGKAFLGPALDEVLPGFEARAQRLIPAHLGRVLRYGL